MISDKVLEIRKRLDEETVGVRPASHHTSEAMWAALFECNPTDAELEEMTQWVWFNARHLRCMIRAMMRGDWT